MRSAALWLVAAATAIALSTTTGCGGDDDRPATFSYIHAAVILPSCTTSSCHTSFNAQAGVRLNTVEAAYAILLGRPCDGITPPGTPDGNFVVPFQPEASRLMYLMLGENVRRPMPPDRVLPDADIDLIERWILDGAPCN